MFMGRRNISLVSLVSHLSRDSLSPSSPSTCALFEQHISQVQMFLSFSSYSLSSSLSSMMFCGSFFCHHCHSSQEAGWDASKRGGMCYHSNKLTHWQGCTIFHWATGSQQQMQPLSCDGSMHLLILGGEETPLCWGNRCSILRPGVTDDGGRGGVEGDHGCFWDLFWWMLLCLLCLPLFQQMCAHDVLIYRLKITHLLLNYLFLLYKRNNSFLVPLLSFPCCLFSWLTCLFWIYVSFGPTLE